MTGLSQGSSRTLHGTRDDYCFKFQRGGWRLSIFALANLIFGKLKNLFFGRGPRKIKNCQPEDAEPTSSSLIKNRGLTHP
jgi:hypothetical protein